MRRSRAGRRALLAVAAGAAGAVVSLGALVAPAAAAPVRAAVQAEGEPEIEEAETTDVVPAAARSGALLVVRDAAAGRTSYYKVVETRDIGSIGTEVLKGAASGASAGWLLYKTTGDDGGAALLRIPAAVAGGLLGGVGGLATGSYDVIFNPDRDVVLVQGDEFVFTAVDAPQVFHLQGTFNPNTGTVIPLDQSFQP